ncbi:MAG: hypothetical protein JNJ83_16780 [Verrucomicrobiaceae bacterium]|nr:hypothetical protein [Verrucomicrobiaceae bacterium]
MDPSEELRLCPGGHVPDTVRQDVRDLLKQTPEREPFLPASEVQFYGATHVIARALGGDQPPPTHARWSHGWAFYYDVPGINKAEFAMLARWNGNDDWLHLCRNEIEADIYKSAGAHAVVVAGLPFFYLPDLGVKRLPNTVLIMPPHSTWQASVKMSERDLLGLAQKRYPDSQLCVCLTASCCLRTGWAEACRELQIPWISGSHPYDATSLNRMKHLMSGFEVILTPKLGSHVIYAAASGARIDFVKDIPFEIVRESSIGDLTAARRSAAHAHLIEEEKLRLETMLQAGGADCQAWAMQAGGAHFRKDPVTVARLLGWTHDKIFPEITESNAHHLETLGWSDHNKDSDLVLRLDKQVADQKVKIKSAEKQVKTLEKLVLKEKQRLNTLEKSWAWKLVGKHLHSIERRLRGEAPR